MQKFLRRHKIYSKKKMGFTVGENVDFVPEYGLCTMCGTCESVCPHNAIEITLNENKGGYEPTILDDKCINCSLCVDTCPGFFLELKGLAANAKEKGVSQNQYIGNYSEILRMQSTDEVISKGGTSGGMVTGILEYLIDSSLIDGAIVTRMNEVQPLETTSYIATSREELLLSQKSKYLPTHLNSILKTIINGEVSQKRLAMVGLPCHIEGLRMAQEVYPILKERIVYVVSLFCSRTPTFHATRFLLQCNHIKERDLQKIDYRGHGHPGKLTFYKSDGTICSVNHLHWTYWGYSFLNFFWPSRCFMCPDKTGELADISIGDNWQGFRERSKASSSVIARTRDSKKLLNEMVINGKASLLNSLTENEFIFDQDLRKKRNIGNRLLLMKLIGRKVPHFDEKFELQWKSLLSCFRSLRHVLMSEHKIPFGFLHTYLFFSYKKHCLFQRISSLSRYVIKMVHRLFHYSK